MNPLSQLKTSTLLYQGMDTSREQKISKDIVELNNTINQLDIMDTYRIFHPTRAEHTFFSSSQGTFIKIDHIMDHKTHLYKLKEKKEERNHTISVLRLQ